MPPFSPCGCGLWRSDCQCRLCDLRYCASIEAACRRLTCSALSTANSPNASVAMALASSGRLLQLLQKRSYSLGLFDELGIGDYLVFDYPS